MHVYVRGWWQSEPRQVGHFQGGTSPVEFSSVAQLCLTFCDPMDCSMPGLPVHHQLREFIQTHVRWVGDAIQPSHPLSSPFSSCLQFFPESGSFPVSQLFTSGGQIIGVSASVLPMNIQDWSPSRWTEFPCSPRDSRESSPTPQFKSIDCSALSFLSYILCRMNIIPPL